MNRLLIVFLVFVFPGSSLAHDSIVFSVFGAKVGIPHFCYVAPRSSVMDSTVNFFCKPKQGDSEFEGNFERRGKVDYEAYSSEHLTDKEYQNDGKLDHCLLEIKLGENHIRIFNYVLCDKETCFVLRYPAQSCKIIRNIIDQVSQINLLGECCRDKVETT